MQLYFVNVGYGESIVIKNAEKAIVIDGGPDDKETYEEKRNNPSARVSKKDRDKQQLRR